MCGIVAVLVSSKHRKVNDIETVKLMTDAIVHRGPDDEGQWISTNGRCGLGFRRLSIIDLSTAGHQPMLSESGSHAIVFNGEIYNHAKLRSVLQSEGFRYRSKTDTESILYGLMSKGTPFLHEMVGMWAIACWDEGKQELFVSRDRIGIKPLYYYCQDGLFICASEIKSILAHPDVRPELNIDELPNYLSFSMSGSDASLFKGIKKVPAGHYLTVSKDAEVQLHEYWSPLHRNIQMSTLSVQETQDQIMRLLRQAVKDRMMSDVPFGVFLSGGIDSSVNVALMSELMDRPVDSFTVGFRELEKYNELEYARQVSEHFHTNHHEILIDHSDALPLLETMVWHEDEPNGDPVCIPLYFLSQLTRASGTTVIQVGEGSDEQLVGYPWMLRELRFYNSTWKYFRSLPKSMQKLLGKPAMQWLKRDSNFLAADYIRRALEDNELYWGGGVDMTPTHQEILFGAEFKHMVPMASQLPRLIHQSAREKYPDLEYLQEMAFFELRHRLPELLLMRVDKLTMAHSLEARVPFLDHRLVEFTMTIPTATKIPNPGATKLLLKKAVESILPHDVIYRKKQGFAAPVSEWIRGSWYSYVENEILNGSLVRNGVLAQGGVEHLLRVHKSGKRNFGKSLYALLNLSLWYKRFIG